MRAFKCDICGNFFEEFKYLEIAKKKSVITTLNDESWVGVHDICPDCIAAIQEAIDKQGDKVGKLIQAEKQKEIIGTNRGLWRGKVKDEFHNIPNGRWTEGNLVITQFQNGIVDYTIKQREYGSSTFLSVDPSTLGVCTNWTDKNEDFIFEGDVLRFVYNGTEHIGVVVWDTDNLSFKITNDLENYNKEFAYISYCEEIEIIGNIHDDPDLLRQ